MPLPLIFLVLSLVLTYVAGLLPLQKENLSDSETTRARIGEIGSGAGVAAVALLLFFVATKIWPSVFIDGTILSVAAALGILVACFSAGFRQTVTAFPLGMAVIGDSMLHLLGGSTGPALLAFVVGSSVGAFCTSLGRPKFHGAYINAVCCTVLVAADFLGRRAAGSDAAAMTGLSLGLSGLVAAVLVVGLRGRGMMLRGLVTVLAVAAVGSLACWKFLGTLELASLWACGAVVAGIVHLIFEGEEEPSGFRFVLSTIIWIAAVTVAFGIKLGYGMSAVLLAGVVTAILLGSARGLMSQSVALSILLYRYYRELQPEGARALDIGQHYSMVGLTLGALLPLLPLEWARARRSRLVISGALWLVLLIGLPLIGSLLLGSKGAVGMIVGFGFATLVEGIRGAVTLEAVGLGVGLGALTTLSYGWLVPLMDIGRDEKTRALVIVAVVLVLIGTALSMLTKPDQREQA